jgi:hypothetical protein
MRRIPSSDMQFCAIAFCIGPILYQKVKIDKFRTESCTIQYHDSGSIRYKLATGYSELGSDYLILFQLKFLGSL